MSVFVCVCVGGGGGSVRTCVCMCLCLCERARVCVCARIAKTGILLSVARTLGLKQTVSRARSSIACQGYFQL